MEMYLLIVLYGLTALALLGIAAMVFWDQLNLVIPWLGRQARARLRRRGDEFCEEDNHDAR
jgi:hypothetical protein